MRNDAESDVVAGRNVSRFALAMAALIPAALACSLGVLYGFLAFYRTGKVGLLDVGWFVYSLASPTGGASPAPIVPYLGESIFGVHTFFTPFLVNQWLALFTSPPANFILFLGLQNALASVAGSMIMFTAARINGWTGRTLTVAVAFGGLALPLSNAVVGSLVFPHPELFGISLLTIGLMLLIEYWRASRSKWVMALGWALLLMGGLAREDMGLHVAVVVIAAWICLRRPRGAAVRRTMFLAIAAVGLAVASYLLQMFVYSSRGVFVGNYSGWPPYAHLASLSAVTDRLHGFIWARIDLIALVGIFVILGMRWRSKALLSFPLAVVPWVVLHVTALAEIMATLFVYFLFPCVLYICTPLLVITLNGLPNGEHAAVADSASRRLGATYVAAISAFVVLGLFGISRGFMEPLGDAIRWAPPSSAEIAQTHSALRAVDDPLDSLAVDEAVYALAPVHFERYPLISSDLDPAAIDAIIFNPAAVGNPMQQGLVQRVLDDWSEAGTPLEVSCLGSGIVRLDRLPAATGTAPNEPTTVREIEACRLSPRVS